MANLLPESGKAKIRTLTSAIGAVAGGTVGSSAFNTQLSGVVGQNAVENNWLSQVEYKKMLEELRDAPEEEHDSIYRRYSNLSKKNDQATKTLLKEKGKDSPEVQTNLQEMNQVLQFSKDQILTAPYRELLNQDSNKIEDMHLNISKMNEHDYQNLKEVRFLEYENLNSLKDYTNKESKAQIKDYLSSKDYERTN